MTFHMKQTQKKINDIFHLKKSYKKIPTDTLIYIFCLCFIIMMDWSLKFVVTTWIVNKEKQWKSFKYHIKVCALFLFLSVCLFLLFHSTISLSYVSTCVILIVYENEHKMPLFNVKLLTNLVKKMYTDEFVLVVAFFLNHKNVHTNRTKESFHIFS